MSTKEWRKANREKQKEYNRKYYSKPENAEKRRKKSAEWLQKEGNRDKKIAYFHRLQYKGDSCTLCGFSIKEALDSHHIIPKALGGSNGKDNLITVCANCHRLLHAGIIDLKTMEETND